MSGSILLLYEQDGICTKIAKLAVLHTSYLKYFQLKISFVLLTYDFTVEMRTFIKHGSSVSRTVSCLAWGLLCFLLSGCEIEQTKIPDYPVFLRRNINEIELFEPGDYLYVKPAASTPNTPVPSSDRLGYGGILLVFCHDALEPYCAFDIACPNCVSPSIRVSEPNDILVSTCPECGEAYDMLHGLGIPTKKISRVGMKKYKVYIDPADERYIIVDQ